MKRRERIGWRENRLTEKTENASRWQPENPRQTNQTEDSGNCEKDDGGFTTTV